MGCVYKYWHCERIGGGSLCELLAFGIEGWTTYKSLSMPRDATRV
jgi:hypothetical protein